jgi:MYXO-CTERM domain-containing protein
MRRLLLASAALTVLLAPASAALAAPLLPPLSPGVEDGILPGNDDGSTTAIPLATAFPEGLRFFGGPYTAMYVNNNGNITFNGPLGTFTPNPFPVATQPMIVPYWADVDTRGGPGGGADNTVFWHLEPGRMLITWHNVGYFSSHDELKMDFQLVVTREPSATFGDFDVEFRYSRCEWESGDASGGTAGFGGTPAQAGFDAGNGVDFVELPGSRVPGIAPLLCRSSNVGEPGVWRFGVRDGGVVCAGEGTPCPVAGVGACSVGVTRCVGREPVCFAFVVPTAELCDGVDNDCNGLVDDVASVCVDAGVTPMEDAGGAVESDLGVRHEPDLGVRPEPDLGVRPERDLGVAHEPDSGAIGGRDASPEAELRAEPFHATYGCGCGCSVSGERPATPWLWSGLCLAALLARRSRRRARDRSR